MASSRLLTLGFCLCDVLGILLALCGSAAATERYVPSEYPSIQAAIDAAVAGDQVVVAAGIYTGEGNRDLDFHGKAITVRSADPNDPNVVAATVINCQGTPSEPHRGVAFRSSEGPDAVLAGLTITGGYGPVETCHPVGPPLSGPVGGAVFFTNAAPTIAKCRFIANAAVVGGGVACGPTSSPIVANCTIQGCTAEAFGGGIYVDESAIIKNCLITHNSCGYMGGGVAFAFFRSNATIANCTVVHNRLTDARGIGAGVAAPSETRITNCIVWENIPSYAQIADDEDPSIVSFCDVQGGWPGATNISADPRFVEPNGPDGDPNTWQDNDYHLTAGSPRINIGDPNGQYADQIDIDGEPRVQGRAVDIGADEWSYPTWKCVSGLETVLPLGAAICAMLGTLSRHRRRY